MTSREAVNWIINISADIGKREHKDLWHYKQELSEIKELLKSAIIKPEGFDPTNLTEQDKKDILDAVDFIKKQPELALKTERNMAETQQALRLIDANALIDNAIKESTCNGAYGYMDTRSIVQMINDAPTVQFCYSECGKKVSC